MTDRTFVAAFAQRSADLRNGFLFGNLFRDTIRADLDTDRADVIREFDEAFAFINILSDY
ncbi:MAG: hypothetical protein ACREEM_47685 [Blastocatellia bacterium]